MKKQPLLILFLSFILGIFFQDEFLWSEKQVFSFAGIGFLLGFLILVKNFLIQKIKVVFVVNLFFSLGMLLHFINSEKPKLPTFQKNEKLIFTLDKKLNSTVKNRRYVIHLQTKFGNFPSVLSVPKELKELDFSHAYRAELWINIPQKPNNNFQFDYPKYLARQNIYFRSYLPKSYEIADRKSLNFNEKIKQNRLILLHKINKSELSTKTQNFLKGIILADRTEMDEITVQDFNKSGLVHFLAISGTHIVIIFWLIMLVLGFLFPVRFRKMSIVFSLFLIWFFAMYIGFGSSVVRSCLMISVYYMYVLLQRKPDLLHSLSLSGIIILFINTNELFDIGFQLSFLAVFGIFWLNQPILNLFPKPKNKLQKIGLSTISISTSAQLATLPLVLFYFHQSSWMSIPANLVIIPFSEIIIIFSLLMTFFLHFEVQIKFIFEIYDSVTKFLLEIIHWFAEQNYAFEKMIPMNIFEVLLCFGIVFSLRFLLKKFNFKILFYVFLLISGFLFLRYFFNLNESRKNEILITNYFKDSIIIEKKQTEINFYFDEKTDAITIKKNIVEPYLTSRRTKSYKIILLKTEQLKAGIENVKLKNH